MGPGLALLTSSSSLSMRGTPTWPPTSGTAFCVNS
jgi:hypothetical protein